MWGILHCPDLAHSFFSFLVLQIYRNETMRQKRWVHLTKPRYCYPVCIQCVKLCLAQLYLWQACGRPTLLGSAVQLYCYQVCVISAHTLLGPVILMLRVVKNTLCLDQLYGCTVILLSSLSTLVWHFVIFSAHNLIGPVILLYISF
jgi:hypothetical protein